MPTSRTNPTVNKAPQAITYTLHPSAMRLKQKRLQLKSAERTKKRNGAMSAHKNKR